MKLLFVHGWGFDAGFWTALAELLPEFQTAFADSGFFGEPCEPLLDGPTLAVTHSLGTMKILTDPPPDCRGLLAINGFDRFTARGGAPGVAPRVVERMIARFDDAPAAVLAEFRRRCGCDSPFGEPDAVRLRQGLLALRDTDWQARSAAWTLPIVSLQGALDPILPLALRETAFAGAPRVERMMHPAAGHLAPISHAGFCAEQIAAFARRLS